jgi:hypothetical protein
MRCTSAAYFSAVSADAVGGAVGMTTVLTNRGSAAEIVERTRRLLSDENRSKAERFPCSSHRDLSIVDESRR